MTIIDDARAFGIHDTMKQRIDVFMNCFPNMTQEEADNIQEILNWDDSTKLAYSFAKRLFEDKE